MSVDQFKIKKKKEEMFKYLKSELFNILNTEQLFMLIVIQCVDVYTCLSEIITSTTYHINNGLSCSRYSSL